MKLTEPPKENLRYYDVVSWLTQSGLRPWTVRLFFERGVIEAHFVTNVKGAFYSAAQIKKALNGTNYQETKTTNAANERA